MSDRKYVILHPSGEEVEPSPEVLSSLSGDFQILVKKEALKEELAGGHPEIVRYLKRFGFEWEPYSDYGHMRFGPYAALIFDLVLEYARQVVRSFDLPIFEVKGTAFFDLKMKPVKEHAALYGDRLYVLKTDKSSFVLRYAACHQQFSMIKDWFISYRDLPFGAFEVADSYRFEKSGEVELCFRLRRFYMPDLHIFVRDEEEAKHWMLKIHRRIMNEMRKLGREYELLVNVVSPKQYEHYKHFLVELAKDVGKPILIAIYPATGLNYYWTLNIEYVIIDKLGRPKEIGTVQIDVGNALRFGIKYVDEDGEERYPVILHTAIIGGIERYIYALFDSALRLNKPMLPVWISPVQVRIIPVKIQYVEYALSVAREIEAKGFRVDVDDTNRSLSRKIVDAEKEWIPYIAVVGETELKSGTLNVRFRRTGEQKVLAIKELVKILELETEGYPRKPRYYPLLVSKRPKFILY
ncbi:MAG: threonine--tRNA ligase [archaeon GB-1867-005]|nr:threonine--tRNA ligase [Candidatus Culexmicrobium cathedralense]